MSFLSDILEARSRSIESIWTPDPTNAPRRDFKAALTKPGVSVIAEFKRRSPSKGILNPDLDPQVQAAAYEAGGASAVSVLAEPDFFDGSGEDVMRAHLACELPVLWKDFVIDPRQIEAAAAARADAILLIVRICAPAALARFIAICAEHELTPLVEVFTADELRVALDAGAEVVGVNARDLETFVETPDLVFELRDSIPEGVVCVAESAIRSRADILRLAEHGIDAALIGEELVRSRDPAARLRELLGG